MDKLLLVDGSNLLFQMFFGMPARIVNLDGKAIQGTLGFVGALLKMIRMIEPTHVLVLFDGEHENSRAGLDPDYKANRPDYSQVPEAESPFSQLPDIYAALDFLGIVHTETTDCETDDLIAGYALRYGGLLPVVISSFDSDFFQLAAENVSVLRYRGEKTMLCGPSYLKEKWGIKPCQYADFKSLTGDIADNIKGAEGIGPKTAARLLACFGTLENILLRAEEIERPFVRDSIIRNAERLKINYKLVKLESREALPFDLQRLAYEYDGITTNEVLRGIGLK